MEGGGGNFTAIFFQLSKNIKGTLNFSLGHDWKHAMIEELWPFKIMKSMLLKPGDTLSLSGAFNNPEGGKAGGWRQGSRV